MRRRRQLGQSVVEFAIAVPILLAILLGIVEGGNLVNNNVNVSNAAREAARAAAVGKSSSDVLTRAQNAASPLNVTSVQLQSSSNNGTTWTTWNGTNNVAEGDYIRVSLTAQNSQITNFLPKFGNLSITQTSVMRREPSSN